MMSKIESKKKRKLIRTLKPLKKDVSPILKWKFSLSQKIAEFKGIHQLSLEEMASLLKIDPANLSRIINGRIEKVTLDKLLNYIEILLIASKDKRLSEGFHHKADKFFSLDDVRFG